MPTITPYESRIRAGGDLGVRASAADFGSGIGAAVANAGQAVTEVSKMYGRMKQDEETLWAYKTTNDAYDQIRTSYEEEVNKLSLDDKDFSTKLSTLDQQFSTMMQEKTSDLLADAPSRHAAQQVESHMLENGYRLREQVHHTVSTLRGEYQKVLLEKGVESAKNSVTQDPSNRNVERTLNELHTTLNSLNNLNPAQKEAYEKSVNGKIAARQVETIATSKPEALLGQIRAGGMTLSKGGDGESSLPSLDPIPEADIAKASPDIKGWSHLGIEQKIAAVRMAESKVGAKIAIDRGETTRALGDLQAAARAGIAVPWDNRFNEDNLVTMYGEDVGKRMAIDARHAHQVGQLASQISTMPVEQAMKMVEGAKPTGGDITEIADKQRDYDALKTAFVNVNIQRSKDYMGWAKTALPERYNDLSFESPDAFRKSLSSRIDLANAGVQDYKAQAHLFSDEEMTKFQTALTGMLPEQQMLWLKEVRNATLGHDDWFTDTMRQVSKTNQMLTFAAASAARGGVVETAIGTQTGEQVGAYVLAGSAILNGKSDKKDFKLDDGKFSEAFWKYLPPGAFASPDPAMSDAMRKATYQSAKAYLAAYMTTHGISPDVLKSGNTTVVNNAIDAVTGGKYDTANGDALFLPWGMNKADFQKQFPKAVDAAVEAAGLKGGEMDVPSKFRYANVGNGKYMLTFNNRPILGTNGKNVIVDMSKFSPRPTDNIGGRVDMTKFFWGGM